MEQPGLFEGVSQEAASERRNGPSDSTASNHQGSGQGASGRAVCALPECQQTFSPYRPFQRFHSKECERKDWARRHPRRGTEEERRARTKKARDEGMASAARHCRKQCDQARRVALEVIGARGAGIISHVREECENRGLELDWALNWPGSLFHASRWFEATGRRLTTFHASANARKVNEYRLSEEGHAALAELRRNQPRLSPSPESGDSVRGQ